MPACVQCIDHFFHPPTLNRRIGIDISLDFVFLRAYTLRLNMHSFYHLYVVVGDKKNADSLETRRGTAGLPDVCAPAKLKVFDLRGSCERVNSV